MEHCHHALNDVVQTRGETTAGDHCNPRVGGVPEYFFAGSCEFERCKAGCGVTARKRVRFELPESDVYKNPIEVIVQKLVREKRPLQWGHPRCGTVAGRKRVYEKIGRRQFHGIKPRESF
jgi:hypothetical protein